jgi:hypothetical protein
LTYRSINTGRAKQEKPMSDTIELFVSSSPELTAEREVLGQAIAALPISHGWEIKHTPRSDEDGTAALSFIQHCDVYIILLGGDFAAPMGLEWERARRGNKRTFAYRKDVPHSPAGRALLRKSSVTWSDFRSPAELKQHVTQSLAKLLLDQGEQFGLHLGDVEGLLLEAAQTRDPETDLPDDREGAGRSGVILRRER